MKKSIYVLAPLASLMFGSALAGVQPGQICSGTVSFVFVHNVVCNGMYLPKAPLGGDASGKVWVTRAVIKYKNIGDCSSRLGMLDYGFSGQETVMPGHEGTVTLDNWDRYHAATLIGATYKLVGQFRIQIVSATMNRVLLTPDDGGLDD